MPLIDYVRGAVAFAGAMAALGWAAVRVRRWLGVGSGQPVRHLVDALVALGILVVSLEVIGAIGQLRPVVTMIAVPAIALAVVAIVPARPDVVVATDREEGSASRWPVLIAGALAALVLAQWVAHAGTVMEGGLRDFDSLRYHAPFAARWVQGHRLLPLQHTSSETQEVFFPANNELLHAYGMLLFGRDLLTPLVNVGWLALAGLAAWSVPGTRIRRASAVAGVSAVCSTPLLASIEPGSAKNDLAAAALVLSVGALVLHLTTERHRRGLLVLIGLAAGLAVGTKLTTLAPVAVLLVGVTFITRPRWMTAVTLAASASLTGSFWYLRNTLAAHNPLPWIRHVGPFTLPAPPMPDAARNGRTVLHYAGDGSFWRTVVLHGVRSSFGPAWWALLAVVALATVVALRERISPPTRVLGAAVLFAIVTYTVTPFSAGGNDGRPLLFALDLRFLTPALLLGAVLVARERLAAVVIGGAAMMIVLDQWAGNGRWPKPALPVLGAVIVTCVLAGAAVRIARAGHPRRLVAAGALSLVVIGVAWPVQADELDDRYANGHSGRAEAYALFRDIHHARVAVGGFADDYPLYGVDLSNRVQFVGVPLPYGGFRPASTCQEWRTALRRGHYDYVVLSRSPMSRPRLPVQVRWMVHDPTARVVLSAGLTRVYRLDGLADPAGCVTTSARR